MQKAVTPFKIGFIHSGTPRTCVPWDQLFERIRPMLDQGLDLLVGPEYLWHDNGKPLSMDARERITSGLERITRGYQTAVIPGTMVWVASPGHSPKTRYYINSADVYLNGYHLYEVQKYCLRPSDYGFTSGTTISSHSGEFYPNENILEGYHSRRFLAVGERRYFVEICDDHPFFAQTLASSRVRPAFAEADVHVVVSCQWYDFFTVARSEILTRTGGLVIESNGFKPASYVARVTETTVSKIGIETGGEDRSVIMTV